MTEDEVMKWAESVKGSDPVPPLSELRRRINLLGASLRQAQEKVAALTRERDLAIAHDRQPYPTAEAYERVCEARTKWQARAEKAEARIAELEQELGREKERLGRRIDSLEEDVMGYETAKNNAEKWRRELAEARQEIADFEKEYICREWTKASIQRFQQAEAKLTLAIKLSDTECEAAAECVKEAEAKVESLTNWQDKLAWEYHAMKARLSLAAEALTKELDIWKKQAAFEFEHRERYVIERDDSRRKLSRAVEALELIAAEKRPDGTWNRDRTACQALAQDALREIGE